MFKKKVKVQNSAGIHARPAAMIVQEASRFESA
ncbi:MAG: HPr family phosphocarrier protein, partial [Bacteroidota bacterium]